MPARLLGSGRSLLDRRRGAFRAIGAGLLDSGFASLATFVVGFYAARVFEPTLLGTYALAFAAFTLASNVSGQLVFVPCEIRTVSLKRKERLTQLGRTLRTGAPVALLTGLGVSAWLLLAERGTPRDTAVGLTVTAMACAVISPIQDHLRRMLHIGGASGIAAVVSTIQFVGIVGLVALALASDLPPQWIPFGVLAGANLISFGAGLLLSRRVRTADVIAGFEIRISDVFRSGRWLLLSVLLASGANFVAAGLVTRLASAAALGYAEAARICAQPIWVFVIGLRAVLGPRSMEAARARDQGRARRISRGFVALVSIVGFAYVGMTAFEWRGNFLLELLPNAYVVPYLVLVWTMANIVTGYQSSLRAELLGASREAGIAMAELWASVTRTAVSATASWTGPLAMPGGFLVSTMARSLGFRRRARRYYAEPIDEATGSVSGHS